MEESADPVPLRILALTALERLGTENLHILDLIGTLPQSCATQAP